MATAQEIMQLRRLIDDTTDPETYTNEELEALLNQYPSADSAAAAVWEEKAASYSTLVNISESGSSRNLGDLHRNALAQAKHFGAKAAIDAPTSSARSRTRGIERV